MPDPVTITIEGDLFRAAKQAFEGRKEATGKLMKQALLIEYSPMQQKREPEHSAGHARTGSIVMDAGPLQAMSVPQTGGDRTMQRKCLTALLTAGMLVLAGCGGASGSPGPTNGTRPQAGVSSTGIHHYGIGPDARRDYREAMHRDCVEEIGRTGCSVSGRGWFHRWNRLPEVHVPSHSRQEEVWVIRRALGILNRPLPAEYRLNYRTTGRTFAGTDRDDWVTRAGSLVPEGVIHAEIYPHGDPESAGVAWTDGEKGFALGNGDGLDLADPIHVSVAVDTMVHEFLHALGLGGHPHPVHTSILSYRHHHKGELDRVPLVDMSVLYDLYGWGSWGTEMETVAEHAGGVHFGADRLHHGTAVISWVDARHMAQPRPEALSGRASYRGTLVGYAPDGSALYGDADLGMDFGRGTGEARFHRITDWEGNWWNRSGYRYELVLYAHYFDSSGGPQERDGIPDVTGAFYGFEAETAAGTLQRPEITAAFGAETRD